MGGGIALMSTLNMQTSLLFGDTTYAYLVEMLQTCFLANPNLIDASCLQKPTKANNISDYNFMFINEMRLAASNF